MTVDTLRRHKGDIMSVEKRSALMARIRGKNTGPERAIAQELAKFRLRWTNHDASLPGRPDFVFRRKRVVVFVDGDFWHGWRFALWRDKLTEHWEAKIAANRRRDLLAHRKLRRAGWRVVRIWEHQIERDVARCVDRILVALAKDRVATRLNDLRKPGHLL